MDEFRTAQAINDIWQNSIFQILLTILVILLIQTVLRAVIEKIVRKLVRPKRYERKIDEEKRENTLINIFSTAMMVILWIIAVIIILLQLDVNLAALATGAGLVGIVVGFGAQNTVKDFLAGMFIIIENQYRVGDIVKLQTDGREVAGFVEDITIRITRLRDLDGYLHTVPNGSIQLVTNLSFDFANVNIDIGVAYDSDISKVESIINKVGQDMLKDETWGKRILEPIQFLRIEDFDQSSIKVKALGKVEPAQQWDVAGLFRRRLKTAFEKNGIVIPFPQIVVHNYKSLEQKVSKASKK